MKNTTNKLLLVLLASAVGVAVYLYTQSANSKKYKIAFPFTQTVSQNTSFRCESLIDYSVTGSKEAYLTNGIESSIEKGTNKASLQIKDDKTVTFLSGASFNAGDIGGVDFTIVKNDDKELVAAMWNDNSMNTIVINKSNGLAAWSKIRSEFPGYGAPTSDSSYMICK